MVSYLYNTYILQKSKKEKVLKWEKRQNINIEWCMSLM